MTDIKRTTVVRIMELKKEAPGYKDPADLFENHPDPGPVWERMIANAKPATSWAIDHLDERHNLTTPNGASDACADMVDALLNQPPVARARYIRELAKKLGEDEHWIRATLNDAIRERGSYYEEHPDEEPSDGDLPNLEEVLDLS